MEKLKGKPRVVSATKVSAILDLLQDMLTEMHLPVRQHERLMRRIKDLQQ